MWSLKVVKGAELADKLVPEMRLPQPLQRFTIGRDPGNSWPIEDRTLAISGRHCEIVGTPAGPALRDLSTNGAFVNGAGTRLMGEHLLRDGDRIDLGPFTIGVSGPPVAEQPFAATVVSAPVPTLAVPVPVRSRNAFDSAPMRGGDPAEMAAHGSSSGAPGLTEILRVAAPADDSDLDLTKIRLAPALSTAGAAALAAVATAPSAAPVPAAALALALARGLGLPVSALEGHDTLLLVRQLALTARAATAAVRQLIEHQAGTRGDFGPLAAESASLPEDNLLRTASTVDPAVLVLRVAGADPVAVMQRSASELCAHEDRLLQALANARNRPPR